MRSVTHAVGHRLFLVWCEFNAKFDGLRVRLGELGRVFANAPVGPAEQVLDYADFHGLTFAVANLNFKRFVDYFIAIVGGKIHAPALADEVESVAGIEPHGLALRCVLEFILASELEVLIGLGTSVKNKEISIDDAFPAVDTTQESAKALESALTAPSTTEGGK